MGYKKLFYPGQEVIALFGKESLAGANVAEAKVKEPANLVKDDLYFIEDYKCWDSKLNIWLVSIRGFREDEHIFDQDLFVAAGNITELTDILEEEAKHAGVNQGLVRRIMNFVRVNFGSVW